MKKKVLVAFLLAAILVYASSASAISFDLNIPFGPGGAGTPVQPPLLTAAFETVAGGVQLTLSAAAGLIGNAYVSEWYFNISQDRFLFPAAQIGQPSDPQSTGFLWSPNNILVSGQALGQGFDVRISFPVESSTSKFQDLFGPKDNATNATNATFLFSSAFTAGIIADWFNELNASGAFYAAAKILTFGGTGESWIASGPVTEPKPKPVPEPGTTVLFGFGLIVLAFAGGRKLRK